MFKVLTPQLQFIIDIYISYNDLPTAEKHLEEGAPFANSYKGILWPSHGSEDMSGRESVRPLKSRAEVEAEKPGTIWGAYLVPVRVRGLEGQVLHTAHTCPWLTNMCVHILAQVTHLTEVAAGSQWALNLLSTWVLHYCETQLAKQWPCCTLGARK